MLKQVLEMYELLDDAGVSGKKVEEFLRGRGLTDIRVETIKGEKGSTDFIQITVPGSSGKKSGGKAPTLGLIGRLGGIGARPERIGIVSDADGAVAVLACALKLADMAKRGDTLPGDIIISTHICPDAPTQPHEPVPFMGSPVDMQTMNSHEVVPEMDAIISVDTTKGNRVINHRGFAISPTVKSGYIMRTSEDLLDIMEWSTGLVPAVFPLATGDITPYGNGVYHLNSILQPSTATDAPVVGVAITTVRPVPGCGTGASRETDIEEASRFCLEVAKAYGAGSCGFYDADEFALLEKRYGSMKQLQTFGL
ncbi:DUF1177 domain-containing protein [Breznakiella homolactica]|nr:DUF1177 domain-containing protein [Breznakiella homolactica]